MTDHHRATTLPTGPKPTAKQQALLRRLALERGMTFTPPRTSTEASREIERLLKHRKDQRSDVRREIRAVQDDLATRRPDATRIRDDEITGYGSTATWRTDQS